jgi:hypothetical protein
LHAALLIATLYFALRVRAVSRAHGDTLAEVVAARVEVGRLAATVERQRSELLAYARTLHVVSLPETLDLRGRDLAGNPYLVDLAEALPLIVYTVDERCAACKPGWSFVKHLASQTACKVRVVGLVLNDKPADWLLRQSDSSATLLLAASGSLWYVLPLAGPARLVLIQRGRVVKWWWGELSDEGMAEVERTVESQCVE